MSISKSFFRKILLPTITGLGIERMIWRSGGHNRLILCYHGATPVPNFKINGRHIATDQLELHFEYFKKHFDVIPVTEFFGNPGKDSGRPQLALTFDDGFYNNFSQVLPLMEKYDIPASFYITTNCLRDPEFLTWADIMEIAQYAVDGDTLLFAGQEFFKSKGLTDSNGVRLFDMIKRKGKERDNELEDFRARYRFSEIKKLVPQDYYRMLTADELIEFARSPLVQIGSHTVNHYNLANIDPDLAEEELRTSRLQLEALLKVPVTTIAYPDGSYNDVVKERSLKAGYKYQLAVKYQCSSDQQDQTILPRFTISNTTTFSSNMVMMSRKVKELGF